jgi:hypothetical protein
MRVQYMTKPAYLETLPLQSNMYDITPQMTFRWLVSLLQKFYIEFGDHS